MKEAQLAPRLFFSGLYFPQVLAENLLLLQCHVLSSGRVGSSAMVAHSARVQVQPKLWSTS